MKQNHDGPETEAAGTGPMDGRGPGDVNRSRRRFTGAGLSTSAILTLSSRPAFATFCSHSGTMSGNLSRPGGYTCRGLNCDYWKGNYQQWYSTNCKPGKANPTTYQNGTCTDYNHITYGYLKSKKSSMPSSRYDDYKAWANWGWSTPDSSYPNPNPYPTTVGQSLSNCGLSLGDPDQTMMQCLWEQPDSLLAEASAAVLNCEYFGEDSFGYSHTELKDFIGNWSDGLVALKDALHYLNNRG